MLLLVKKFMIFTREDTFFLGNFSNFLFDFSFLFQPFKIFVLIIVIQYDYRFRFVAQLTFLDFDCL